MDCPPYSPKFDEHGASSNSRPEETPITSILLRLPVELRQDIYGLLFHESPRRSDPCYMKWTQGCRCGNNLSLVNRQLYKETRNLVYRYGNFCFKSPQSCIRFLDRIGTSLINDLGSMCIRSDEDALQSYNLQDVFARFIDSKFLRTLRLEILSWTGRDDLVYMPKACPAAVYDLSLRTCRHPLAGLKFIRNLTVVGDPGAEVEEAIFNVIIHMEDLAQREGKVVRKLHVRDRCRFMIAKPDSP